MFGIDNFGVGMAFALTILSTLLCVVYGIINWNRGSDEIDQSDLKWSSEEKQIEDEL